MDEEFKMDAVSDGDPLGEPKDLDQDQVEAFADDEEEDLETAGILTSSDDDEVITEETVVEVIEEPFARPAPKIAKKSAPKVAKKTAPKQVKKVVKKAVKKSSGEKSRCPPSSGEKNAGEKKQEESGEKSG
jgi:hypothetical protein